MVKRIIILMVLLGYGILINSIVRPYIYKNNLNDLGISDMGNNIIFIPALSLLNDIFVRKYIINKTFTNIIHFLVLSLMEILSIRYEVLGVYDFVDIIGLFIGLLISMFINHALYNKKRTI